MKEFKLTTTLLNNILGYLGTRPYKEVNQLIQSIYNETKPQLETTPPQLEVVKEGTNGTETA